jgi:hypothetical protein
MGLAPRRQPRWPLQPWPAWSVVASPGRSPMAPSPNPQPPTPNPQAPTPKPQRPGPTRQPLTAMAPGRSGHRRPPARVGGAPALGHDPRQATTKQESTRRPTTKQAANPQAASSGRHSAGHQPQAASPRPPAQAATPQATTRRPRLAGPKPAGSRRVGQHPARPPAGLTPRFGHRRSGEVALALAGRSPAARGVSQDNGP